MRLSRVGTWWVGALFALGAAGIAACATGPEPVRDGAGAGGSSASGGDAGGSNPASTSSAGGGAPASSSSSTTGAGPSATSSSSSTGSGSTSSSSSTSASSTTSSSSSSSSTSSGTVGAPCAGAVDIVANQNVALGTTSAACYRTNVTIAGWQCSNFDGRTVTVDGAVLACGTVPSGTWTDGYVYFAISAGTYSYASFSFW